jgi:hypothetical protein
MDDPNLLRPLRSDAWDAEKAAHLARRAGFGATPEELEELIALGLDGAVSRFVDFPAEDPELEERIRDAGSDLDVESFTRGAYGEEERRTLRCWWLFRMVYGGAPLAEKLALLWHDHFACQATKVTRLRLLRQQNELFRRRGANSFRELVSAVARDPSMLVFLDNRISGKDAPNENWARELVELFTLGVDRYTQDDVTELARVFTGWTTERRDSDEFAFRPEMHDAGDKTVLDVEIRGRVGPAGEREGDEAIDVVLARPDAAPFVAGKLCGWFADHRTAPDVVAAVGRELVEQDWSVREALRALFTSAWFHAPERIFARFRNPVEQVVGAVRALGLQNAHLARLDRHLADLGMLLFEPPSVAGWDHGEAWVQTGSVAPRLNLALELSELPHAGRTITGRATIDLDALGAGVADDAGALVDHLAARLSLAPLSAEQRAALVGYLDGSLPPLDGGADARESRDRRRARVRAAIHLVLAAPQAVYA